MRNQKMKPSKGKSKSCGCALDKSFGKPTAQANGEFKSTANASRAAKKKKGDHDGDKKRC